MVTTRRNHNGRPPSKRPRGVRDIAKNGDTIVVREPVPKKKLYVPITPTVPVTTLPRLPSSTGGMEDISFTSPSVGTTSPMDIKSTPKQKATELAPDRTVSSALRRFIAKSGTTKGSADNPIVLEEYSPRRKSAPLPKRRRRTEPEPHKFQDRHRKLYTYRPPRTALASKPANGSTFTGDKSNDLYRMVNAKMTAEGWYANGTYGRPPVVRPHVSYGIPFDVHYPLSAQYLAQATTAPTQKSSSYAHHHERMGVTIAGDSEDMLRKKAVQCIRDYSRPQPRNKTLSDDPDETSASETEQTPRKPGKIGHSKLNIYQDPNDHLTPLITQTTLITSLLQVYPRSIYQKSLREDIAMLVSVQNQCMTDWLKSESASSKKRRRSNTDSAIDVGVEELDMQQRERDEEMRGFLSAGAGMWQDGSGVGVADVFAGEVEGVGEGDVGECVDVSVVVEKGVSIEKKRGVCELSMVECW
ncbi:hypothetical protein EK21DRAFT_68710 [Setomelanomma holmii]|uniref:Uncharacterized protein n=1 Tax=Setomelanomma holmii TaxID=210430 RepID=A0A9P4LKN8_9PLEO|nr:hypothetical protein EK21DRAFT_68710 [Setomelanomma holmii]